MTSNIHKHALFDRTCKLPVAIQRGVNGFLSVSAAAGRPAWPVTVLKLINLALTTFTLRAALPSHPSIYSTCSKISEEIGNLFVKFKYYDIEISHNKFTVMKERILL